ncbi:DUF3488 domain-containing protein [Pseudothauera nasutitermitis]|uniref:DUF3488 domain-containing protein n=1 Tax=Pseudothauera nasutitermitis TaxID=2565930 RepID=A0A4S4AZX6_9RHOO|nr:DUF3488 and transglutaminase-like domain-containing protein [Pseudothauera nasutitermitis]THF65753.1 DUF3488 domain-containing protein [Pseudothauera nasutitermitis]
MPPNVEVSRRTAFCLLAAASVTVLPHAGHLPPWLVALCVLLLGWRGAQLLDRVKGLPRWLVLGVALAAALAIKIDFGHFFGKDPGVALLAVLLCLKLLEGGSPRDARVAVLLSFFLQLGLFFYDQTMGVAALALAGTLLAVTALFGLHQPRAPLPGLLRGAATLVLQGLPFMLVLFVFFPRIEGPLWGLPADAHSAVSGLSDTMEPGSISELSLSDAIAFRAAFAGEPPPNALRYWRGPVLTEFDGRTWRAVRTTSTAAPAYQPGGPVYAYSLTLEAHNRRWLLALDYPDAGLDDLLYADDFQLLAARPVRARARFDLRSRPHTPVGMEESAAVLAAVRRLPAQGNPRARALAARLAADGADAGTIVSRAFDHFASGNYTYTLTPTLLGAHSVDEFLFDTLEGFCEHYASAFVFLMRAAGLPARVVTGYQGGQVNPIDDTVVVRQSDAHAWAEVWIDGQGWRRVDPTAAAAPQRIERGLGESIRAGDPRPLLMRPEFSWLREFRHRWEAVSNHWNLWVLGYNEDRQRDLLARLGLETDWRTLTLATGAAAGLLMLALLGWAFHQRRSADPLDQAWQAFCRRAARHGLPRHAWEGPLDFATRLADRFPAHAGELRRIASDYARMRYRAADGPAAVRELSQRIRRIDFT